MTFPHTHGPDGRPVQCLGCAYTRGFVDGELNADIVIWKRRLRFLIALWNNFVERLTIP
jgi:hypothetical protein